MADARAELDAGLRREALAPVDDPGLAALVAAIRARAEGEVAAVLFYGSGLWQAVGDDTVHDFYVLVERPRDFDRRPLVALLGRLLPPNVYYLETRHAGGTLRAKCAVMTLEQFARAAAGRAATPQIWARFAQPCRLVHARDAAARDRVLAALAYAVVTFHRKILPLVPAGADARDIWRRGLAETYGRELRSESSDRAASVFDAQPEAFAWRTRCAVPLTGLPAALDDAGRLVWREGGGRRRRARLAAALARPLGKLVALLRLMKATVTFEGGVDYVLWKIERHSGVRVEPSAFTRRHPLIGGWALLVKLYRRGAFR